MARMKDYLMMEQEMEQDIEEMMEQGLLQNEVTENDVNEMAKEMGY